MKKRFAIGLLLFCICCTAFPVGVVSASRVNIVSGMPYTIMTGVPTSHSYDLFSEDGRTFDNDSGYMLTDGKRASGDHKDNAWYQAFRSQSRCVDFAFDAPVSVSGFSAGFYHGNGYTAPRYLRLWLSDNGEEWFLASESCPNFSLNASARSFRLEKTLDAPYKAQYVRVEFCVDIFALCDEIEVYGSKTCDGTERTFEPTPEKEPSYCTSLGDAYGITDIIKMYNGYYPSSPDLAKNTAEELLPYIAYLASDGTVKDTMFDAVAFVPCVQGNFTYPSGGTLVKVNSMPSAVQSDWIYYTDFLFAKGYDLDALDSVVGTVYEQLGIDKKFPVLLTMPYPGKSEKPFGDIDGDGVNEYTRTVSERVAVIKWYDEYLSKRFEDAGFAHLDFIGYYWYEEEVNYVWSEDEAGFTQRATQTLKDNGKVVLFDPFYLSVGFDHWQELGFTGAVMQPNVAFTESRPYFELPMLEEFAEAIGRYTLGVEIETNEPSYFTGDKSLEACRNYEQYLYTGMRTGYMDSLHTFYQGAGPGSIYNFCKSSNAKLRRLYDITYAFIKGTYQNLPPTVTLPEYFETQPGQKLRAAISVSDTDSYPGDLHYTDIICAHGRAAVTSGALVYQPDEGYVGVDTVTFTVTDGFNPPATYSVDIRVGQTEEPTSDIVSEPSSESGNGLTVLLIVLSVLVVGATVVLVLIVKRKK